MNGPRPRSELRARLALALVLALSSGCADGPDDESRDLGAPDLPRADAGDVGTPPAAWAHCPPASAFVGDVSWPIELDATEDAVYCTRFDEARTLREELDAKAQLRIVAGTYRLPTTDGAAPFSLPLCMRFADGPGPVSTTGGSSIDHSSAVYGEDTHHQLPFSMALDAGTMSGRFYLTQRGDTLPSPVFDGSPADPFGDSGFQFDFGYCEASECVTPGLAFDSCTHATSTRHQHHVALAGGDEVHFELRVGESVASTEPAAFVRAHGELDGVAFDQRDYFHLVYSPTHHHFERHFAVLFDAPIAGVCGIEVDGLEPWDDYTPDTAHAIECDLDRIRALTVESHTWEVE